MVKNTGSQLLEVWFWRMILGQPSAHHNRKKNQKKNFARKVFERQIKAALFRAALTVCAIIGNL
jgi:hypothetical protein